MAGSWASDEVRLTVAEKCCASFGDRNGCDDGSVIKEWRDGVNEWRGHWMDRRVGRADEQVLGGEQKTRNANRGLGVVGKGT